MTTTNTCEAESITLVVSSGISKQIKNMHITCTIFSITYNDSAVNLFPLDVVEMHNMNSEQLY